MGQEIRSKIQVGEQEIRAYYEANPKRFSDEMFQARHIYFMINEKMPEADVKRVMAQGNVSAAGSQKRERFRHSWRRNIRTTS